jgi:GDP-L-fucose synthase
MEKDAKIFIAGDKSLEGGALIQYFRLHGFDNVLSESMVGLNLAEQDSVYSFFKKEKPEYLFLTHLKSGGIVANMKYPAEFIYTNLQIQNNIVHASYISGVKKLLFLGSSCVYPKNCLQPMKEKYLLTGELEKTNESYSIAKIVGIKMCQAYSQQYHVNYISVIPATIYGPEDDFDLEKSHVFSSLIRKFHKAKLNNEKSVIVWGTGRPRREFIYVDDIIDACIFLMDSYNSSEVINIGCGEDISIEELALLIKDTVGFKGEIIFDQSKPDGVVQKLLDNSKIRKLGWSPKITLEEGVTRTYNWYKERME